MSNIEREKVDGHIDSLIKTYFTYGEIESNLKKNTDLSVPEISATLKTHFIAALRESIRIYRISLIVFGALTLGLLLLYSYGEKEEDRYIQQKIAEGHAYDNGDGTYMVFGVSNRFEIFRDLAIWPAGVALLCILRIAFILLKITRVKNGSGIENMVVREIRIHKYDKLEF
jgi:hypothetical protein